MFQVKAQHSEQLLIKAGIGEVRDFFAETRNFIEMMPNIESIQTDGKGVTRWRIRADIPLLGAMIDIFAVALAEDSAHRIEWLPAAGETKNFMRYAADLEARNADETLVKITQSIELKRASAFDLHFLAPFAGEEIISREMQKRIAGMMKKFLQKARAKLEKTS